MDLTDEATSRTRLRLGILGPLSASLDGVDVGLGGRRQQAVVAVLLVARGQQVSAERLLDTLWDGTPPPSGAASLQSYVSHVRRALEPDRAPRTPSQVLVSRGSGYALVVEDGDVDAWRFEDLVAGAARRPSRPPGPPAAGGAGAVAGTGAGGVRRQGWADTEARRLGELRDVPASSSWRPVSTRARRDRRTGGGAAGRRGAAAGGALADPGARALPGAPAGGRPGRAARARDTARGRARRRPGTALRALEAEVLAQSPALDAPRPPRARSERRPAPEAGPAPNQRPPARPELVDRKTSSALRDCDGLGSRARRCVLVEGPAGIGKTRLLTEARGDARRRCDGAVRAGQPAREGVRLRRRAPAVRTVLERPRRARPAATGAAAGRGGGLRGRRRSTRRPRPVPVLHGLYWLTSNLAAPGRW